MMTLHGLHACLSVGAADIQCARAGDLPILLHDRVWLVRHLAASAQRAPGESCGEVVHTTTLLPGACMHAGCLLTCSGVTTQAAPVAAHAFCNVLGFPDFGSIAEHPRPRTIALAFAAGTAVFAAGLLPLTRPALFSNASRDGGNAYIDACRQLV